MRRLDEEVTTPASFAWFALVLFAVLLVAVLLWSFLDGPVHQMLNLTTTMTDSQRADQTTRNVRYLWEYWPLWGAALAALLIGFRRAIMETGRR